MTNMSEIANYQATLAEAGWEPTRRVPKAVWDRLESESYQKQKFQSRSPLRYVTCFFEAYQKGDEYIVLTDGGAFVTVNADCMVCVSANKANGLEHTGFFAIGGSDECVNAWLAWAGTGCDPEKRPDRGFRYVS